MHWLNHAESVLNLKRNLIAKLQKNIPQSNATLTAWIMPSAFEIFNVFQINFFSPTSLEYSIIIIYLSVAARCLDWTVARKWLSSMGCSVITCYSTVQQ